MYLSHKLRSYALPLMHVNAQKRRQRKKHNAWPRWLSVIVNAEKEAEEETQRAAKAAAKTAERYHKRAEKEVEEKAQRAAKAAVKTAERDAKWTAEDGMN
jgi:hypothetical protein